MRPVTCVLVLALLLLVSVPARGDGPTRPATPAEKEYSLRTLTALASALPRPFPGFEAQSASPLEPFALVSPGCEAEPLAVDYTVTWTNPQQAEKERGEEDAAIARAAARIGSPESKKRQQELMARLEKQAQALGQAISKSDTVAVERIQKEMEKLGQELSGVGNAQNALLEEETKALTKLSEIRIHLKVNSFFHDLPASHIRDARPRGGALAYAYRDPGGKFSERMTAFVGPWKKEVKNGQACFQAARAKHPHTRAQTVTIDVTGDPSLTARFLDDLDWSALQALIR